MKLHLNQEELFEAVVDYMAGLGIPLAGRNIDIKMKAGRGDRGHYADIYIRKDPKSEDESPFEEEIPDPDANAINFDD